MSSLQMGPKKELIMEIDYEILVMSVVEARRPRGVCGFVMILRF